MFTWGSPAVVISTQTKKKHVQLFNSSFSPTEKTNFEFHPPKGSERSPLRTTRAGERSAWARATRKWKDQNNDIIDIFGLPAWKSWCFFGFERCVVFGFWGLGEGGVGALECVKKAMVRVYYMMWNVFFGGFVMFRLGWVLLLNRSNGSQRLVVNTTKNGYPPNRNS